AAIGGLLQLGLVDLHELVLEVVERLRRELHGELLRAHRRGGEHDASDGRNGRRARDRKSTKMQVHVTHSSLCGFFFDGTDASRSRHSGTTVQLAAGAS